MMTGAGSLQSVAKRRERGEGRVYQPTYTVTDPRTGTKTRKTSDVWWIRYSVRGERKEESSKSRDWRVAERLLRKRLGELAAGVYVGPDVEKTTFADLAGMVEQDYQVNGRRSADRLARALTHLRAAFGEARALDLTTDRITAYVAARQEEGAANASINYELAALKRMFRLGERTKKVAQRPYIPMLHVQNARKGFFEPEDFRAVLASLPAYLTAPMQTAYITGWRLKSELLTRQRHHVDLDAGWLRLDPGETKNGEGRMFPLTPELRGILGCQLAETRALEQAQGRIIPWLFHRQGEPIKSFRRAWLTACKRAGVPGRIPHDFRRTAVRNLERAGVPRSAAMKMVGHKTEAIYRRYAIADEGMLREGAEKLARLHQADQQGAPARQRRILPFTGGSVE